MQSVCPRHKAVPARRKFAEWSEPETRGKAVLLGKDWLGRAPQEVAEAEVEGTGQSVALRVLRRKAKRERRASARSEWWVAERVLGGDR